nr:hypothetical protein Iba_chr05fCG5040 [Ipomoea batatas]
MFQLRVEQDSGILLVWRVTEPVVNMGTAKWALLNRFLEGRFCIRAILIDNLSAVRFIEASLSSASPEDVEAGFLSSDVSALASLVRFLRCCDLALVALGTSTWFSIGEHGCSRTFSFISSELWPEIGTGTTSSAAGFICSPTLAVLEIFSDSASNSLLALDLPGTLDRYLNWNIEGNILEPTGNRSGPSKFPQLQKYQPRVITRKQKRTGVSFWYENSRLDSSVHCQGPTTSINVLLWYTLASHSQHQQRANFIESLIHRIKETPNTALLRHLLKVVSKGLQSLTWNETESGRSLNLPIGR